MLGTRVGSKGWVGVWCLCSDRTCGDDRFHACAVDEGPLDGLCPHVRPVNTLLSGVIVQHRDIVNIRHSEGDDVVVVRGIQVHPPDLHLTCVQQELLKLCRARGRSLRQPPNSTLPTTRRAPSFFCLLLALGYQEAPPLGVTSCQTLSLLTEPVPGASPIRVLPRGLSTFSYNGKPGW